jgi:hypothetical protein
MDGNRGRSNPRGRVYRAEHDGGRTQRRLALPHMHRGVLKVGAAAPDARLVALDGETRFHLREHLSGRPLVLVFGSFT